VVNFTCNYGVRNLACLAQLVVDPMASNASDIADTGDRISAEWGIIAFRGKRSGWNWGVVNRYGDGCCLQFFILQEMVCFVGIDAVFS